MDGSSRPNVRNTPYDISRTSNFGKKVKAGERPTQGRELRCYECGGFGHIKWDYPNYLKRQDKGLNVIWSDEDAESEAGGESAKHVTTLTGTYIFDGDSSDEELTFEELAATYKELCIKSVEVVQENEKYKKLIMQLQDIK